MRLSEFTMIPFSDDLPVMYDDCSNHRIWSYVSQSTLSQLEASPHVLLMNIVNHPVLSYF